MAFLGQVIGLGIATRADRLSIERDEAPDLSREHARPGDEGRLERLGVEQGEDPRVGVVGGRAVGHLDERGEPVALGARPQLDLGEGVGPAHDREQGAE